MEVGLGGRVLLVVEVVDQADHAPHRLVLAGTPGTGPHRRLDRQGVLDQARVGGVLGEQLPGVVTGGYELHGASLREYTLDLLCTR